MRLATWNVELFDGLFVEGDRLVRDDGWSRRWNVTRAQQADAIATVMRALDADALMVIEAPDTSSHRSGEAALRDFAETYDLRTREALIGFANDTRQEIALLYDPDRVTARHAPGDTPAAPRFDGTFDADLAGDGTTIEARWSKPPLEVALSGDGLDLHLIGVHAKSKAAHGDTPDERMRVGAANRRKQLSQCLWLRARVDALLRDDPGLVVMGDFNDGPGLDDYEAQFGLSGVEIVLGHEPGAIPLYDPHATLALGARNGARHATARFRAGEGAYLSALLDYVMVSPRLRERTLGWRIWHPFDDPEILQDDALRTALLTASDHFPVTLDIGA